MIEIAIDGTSASGKGTLAKKLSKKYSIPHLDTGLMYRKIASEIIKNKENNLKNILEISCKIAKTSNFENLQKKWLNKKEILALLNNNKFETAGIIASVSFYFIKNRYNIKNR